MKRSLKNKEKTGVRISLIIFILGAFFLIGPFLIQMDMMEYGFASVFIGGFIALTGFISIMIFGKRAKVRQRMLTGDVLARWTYDRTTWERIVANEISDTAGLKVMGIVIGGLFAAIGIIFFLADSDNAVFFGIMMGLAVFFALVGFISYRLHKRKYLNAEPEAVICHDGIYFMGQLTDWNRKTSVLDAVGFHPKTPDTLVFSSRELGGRRIPRMIRTNTLLPVPAGQEPQAAMVVQYFNLPLGADLIRDLNKEEEEA